jgi:preprotein translocase subunit SecY
MLEKLRNIFQVPELKRRILFTLLLFIVYRLGEHVPTPGVNGDALSRALERQRGTLFGLYDLFVGGGFSRATIFALGIMPYISSSIIIQLLGAVVPYFEKLRKEGEEGQKKLTQLTRYGTVMISIVQSLGYAVFLQNPGNFGGEVVVPHPGPLFAFSTILTQTTGTIFVMWLGEKITEHGIGNGISLIIFVNILGGVPNRLFQAVDSFRAGAISPFMVVAALAIMVAVIAVVIVMTQATRKIPVQYAKRIVGRRMFGGASTHIPLRVNTAGVIPIIFASSLMILPATVAGFVGPDNPLSQIGQWFNPLGFLYNFFYAIIIIFFTYFYTAVVLNPNDLGGEHAQVRRVRSRHPAGAQDRRVHRPGAVAHHAAGRGVPGAGRGAARRVHRLVRDAVPDVRRHERADRGRSGAGYAPADRVAPADAPLRGLRQARPHSWPNENVGAMRIVLLGPPGVGKGTQGRRAGAERGWAADLDRRDPAGRRGAAHPGRTRGAAQDGPGAAGPRYRDDRAGAGAARPGPTSHGASCSTDFRARCPRRTRSNGCSKSAGSR